MKLHVNALSFNIKTLTGKKTKKTSVTEARNNQGQSCTYNDIDSIFWIGLIKNSIPFNKKFNFTIGKRGKEKSIHEKQDQHILTSLFGKIRIQSNVSEDIIELVDQQYAISLIRESEMNTNAGKHMMKLFASNNFKYDSLPINETCIGEIRKVLNLNNNSAWCVTDINIDNNDVLIFSILVLDKDKTITLSTNQVGEEMERFRQMLNGKQPTMTLLDIYKLLDLEKRKEIFKNYLINSELKSSEKYLLYIQPDCFSSILSKYGDNIYNVEDSKICDELLLVPEIKNDKKLLYGGKEITNDGTAQAAVTKYMIFLKYLERAIDKYNYSKTIQQIIFGAPGTGKSYSINKTIGDSVKIDMLGVEVPLPKDGNRYVIPDKMEFRTTFHPEYDYAQFVGCYKPIVADEDGKEVTYQFVPQVFTDAYVEAWNNPNKPVFLVIEEINRGNCAQIFGDIFQLLDRNKNGESEYSIQPDKDLQKYLFENLSINAPNVDENVRNGEALLLPKNFNILATMNTSDQSLYPMDSAFKRRWEWKYTPTISKTPGKSKDFKIYLGDNKDSDYCDWLEFVSEVNKKIKKATKSEDKQLGEYFIKGDVLIDEFISKVMFYLWTDVCKENYKTKDNFFRTAADEKDTENNVEFTFNELASEKDEDENDTKTDKVTHLKGFMKYLGVEVKNVTPKS